MSSSGSSSRAASASRSAGLSCSASVPSANVAQSRTAGSGSADSAISAASAVLARAAAERERDRLADAVVGVGALLEQPVLAVRRAEVAERAGDRGEHARVLLARGHRAQRRLLLGRQRRGGRAELAEHVRGELAHRGLGVGAQLHHRVAAPRGVPRAASAQTCGCHSSSSSTHSARAAASTSVRSRSGSAGS